MSTFSFSDRLHTGIPLVADGATGTNLLRRGLPEGTPPERWVLERPELIQQLAAEFVAAGADIILTCTFGATALRLRHADLGDRMAEINARAAALARAAVAGTATLVAGSLGPTGEMLKPYGPLAEEEAAQAYADQARILTESGVDLLVIETQFDLTEAKAALRGVRSVSPLPVVVSFSFDRGTRTMMGVKPEQVGREFTALGADAIGINCGRSLEDNVKALHQLRAATELPLWFKPNAGLPHTDEITGQVTYNVTPEQMGAAAPTWLAAGAQIVGGCCGTSPEHLQAIARAVKTRPAPPQP